jgi:hypothetical protein
MPITSPLPDNIELAVNTEWLNMAVIWEKKPEIYPENSP